MAGNPEHDLEQRMKVSMAETRVLDKDPFINAPVQVGMDLFVEMKIGSNRHKIRTQLVGFRRGEYLIIGTPRVGSSLVTYADKRAMVIRYFLDGAAYGFAAEVLRTMGPPFNLTFLKFPETIEQMTLRKSPRIPVVIPINREGGNVEREAIVNLSASGALLQMNEAVAVDSKIEISFTLPSGISIQNMVCIVRRSEASPNRVLVGVQFDETHAQYAAIGEYIEVFIASVSSSL
ncbi:MAG: flagellar brake protein [Myxococcales bacterium]|nr:MAG: flagellar brake protein [Myxococcales bacterium]